MRTRVLAVAASSAVLLLGVACSSEDSTSAGPDSSVVADAPRNEADATFAHGMIPHHEQAVVMTKLAPERTENAQVLDLAERIEAAQTPEIDQMKGWLEAWNEPHKPGMGGMAGMGGMKGMMSDDQMAALTASSGPAFDKMFLEMMIVHHEGAVEQARAEKADGKFPEAVTLADEIIASQESEIDEMRGILTSLV
ncbi:MAG: DUF305 domain-containing protein [Actinobacteria bacterium]|nr:DUF305 domain-containing protein [Actinomycetota bacterium]